MGEGAGKEGLALRAAREEHSAPRLGTCPSQGPVGRGLLSKGLQKLIDILNTQSPGWQPPADLPLKFRHSGCGRERQASRTLRDVPGALLCCSPPHPLRPGPLPPKGFLCRKCPSEVLGIL